MSAALAGAERKLLWRGFSPARASLIQGSRIPGITGATTWGGVENDSGQSIAAGPDGGVYVAGFGSAPPYVVDG